MGNFIPAYTGRIVYIGHGPQTIYLQEKIKIIDWFFRNNENEKKYEFLTKNKITHLFYSQKEKEIGDYNPTSKNYLKKLFRVNKTVYCKLDHVSQSGMSRRISFYVSRKNNIIDITWHIGNVTGYKISKNGGLNVGGCGMDMGFHLVHNLSYILYPDGFECIGKECPSNDHSNGDRDYTPHHHKSGAYALRQNWL